MKLQHWMVVAPLIVAGATGFLPAHDSAGQPSPLVVLVHGRGQLSADTALLRREWVHYLNAALALDSVPPLQDADVRLAWYADVLDPTIDVECGAAAAASAEAAGAGELLRFLFTSLLSGAPEDESAPARGLFGEMLYFLDDDLRCIARERLKAIVAPALAAGRPVVVVAYSLGALVAHDYLMHLDTPRAPVHLVTIGSPLGTSLVRELAAGSGGTMMSVQRPPAVTSWINLYHPDDPFAAPVGVKGVTDVRIDAPWDGNAHFHGHYLQHPSMGRALRAALGISAP